MRKKGRNRHQQKIWDRNQELVLKAIREVERENTEKPYASVARIRTYISKKEKQISRQRVYAHLKELEGKKRISKVGRGLYSSTHALISKAMYQSFIIKEQMDEIPKLTDEELNELVSETFVDARLLAANRHQRNKVKLAEQFYKKKTLEDLSRIEKATRITVFSRKKMGELEAELLRRSVAQFLVSFIQGEQHKQVPDEAWYGISKDGVKRIELLKKLKKASRDKKLLENCAMHIVISFDPKREPNRLGS